jgi:hypothetical protein
VICAQEETGSAGRGGGAAAPNGVKGPQVRRTPRRHSDWYPEPEVGMRTVSESRVVESTTVGSDWFAEVAVVGLPEACATGVVTAWVGIPSTKRMTTTATASTIAQGGRRFIALPSAGRDAPLVR